MGTRLAMRDVIRDGGGLALFLLVVLHDAHAQDLYSLIPDPTDFYGTQGLSYFDPNQIRFSQTVRIYATRDKKYWGPTYDPLAEDYYMDATKQEITFNEEFELLDAGTMNNLPLNTRPRQADLFDSGTQHFSLRFNESFYLRSESINKYI